MLQRKARTLQGETVRLSVEEDLDETLRKIDELNDELRRVEAEP